MKPSCIRTYATLCIYSDTEKNLASLVFRLTGLRPSRVVANDRRSFKGHVIPRYGWFLSSQEDVFSLDVSEHISWILRQMEGGTDLGGLADAGCRVRISCLWESEGLGGGPALDQSLLRRLADQSIDLEFDIYFSEEGEA